MKFLHVVFFLLFCLYLFPSAVYAGKLENSFAAAQKAYQENRLDEAAEGFGEVAAMLVRNKQIPQARLVLGNVATIRIRQEKYREALDTYAQALKLPGKVAADFQQKAWGNMAVCHHHLGEFALKADYLERLIKLSTDKAKLADWYAQLGDAYKALELYSRAVPAYAKAAELLPQDGDREMRLRILTAWGLCAGNLGDFVQAEKLLAEVISSGGEPLTRAESSSNLGILKWEQGYYPEAADLLLQSLDIEKEAMLRRNEGVDSNNYGLVLKSAGRHEEAKKYFSWSIAIAREVGNVRDEAIALSNMALVARITGDHASARRDYVAALELYEKDGFREGRANTLLGLGKIYEVADNDYARALNCYRQANAIYEELEMPRGIAESLNQMGRCLRKAATPKRAARDLVFDDEEITLPSLEPAMARRESVEAYTRALSIAKGLGMRELIWSAHQGLGFALREEGKNAEALAEYEKAIALVTSMRGSQSDVELLGEYMKDKGELFTEAMELCVAQYKETGEQSYMVRAMELDEIYRNEIIKANTQLVRMDYAEPEKQKLYQDILSLAARRDKVASHTPALPEKTNGEQTPEEARQAALLEEEAKASKERVVTLEKTFNDLLAEWKKRYPEDAAMFDSNAKIDTAAVQASLEPDELVLNYISLPDTLIIVSIAKEFVRIYAEPVTAKEIDEKIKKDFLMEMIEGFRDVNTPVQEEAAMRSSTAYFSHMYDLLISPVKDDVQNKDRLIIITSGFLAQFPFMALVTNGSDPVRPAFLVEDKEIVHSRLTFFDHAKSRDSNQSSALSIVAAGNPRNSLFPILKSLKGAEVEVEKAAQSLGVDLNSDNIKYNTDATETWIKNLIINGGNDIIYFATHGMPFSDTYTSYYVDFEAKIAHLKESTKDKFRKSKAYMEQSLHGLSMLNGYLYMAESEQDDGFLTIKELLEFPNDALKNSKIVILSACNTGVSFAPKALEDDEIMAVLSSETVEKELRGSGWVPSIDQISFVDTFMKRGVKHTYGTLWFADDRANAYILPLFIDKSKTSETTKAYTEAIRKYLEESKKNNNLLGNDWTSIPQHPYFWAVGAIFGH